MLSLKNSEFIKKEQCKKGQYIIFALENFNQNESNIIFKELSDKNDITIDFYEQNNPKYATTYLTLIKTKDYKTYVRMSTLSPKYVSRLVHKHTFMKGNDDAINLVDIYGNTTSYNLSPMIRVTPRNLEENQNIIKICEKNDNLYCIEMQNGKFINIYTNLFYNNHLNKEINSSKIKNYEPNSHKKMQDNISQLFEGYDSVKLDECGKIIEKEQEKSNEQKAQELTM